MKFRLMKCGHLGYGQTSDGRACCAICDCDEVADESSAKDLTNRKARCYCCGKVVNSSYSLPFFHTSETEYDTYYCGCGGWD